MIPCQRELFTIPENVAYFNCAYTSPLLKSATAIGHRALTCKTAPWALTTDFFFSDLNANVFASARGDSIRIAPHLYNTDADVERLFQVLQTRLG